MPQVPIALPSGLSAVSPIRSGVQGRQWVPLRWFGLQHVIASSTLWIALAAIAQTLPVMGLTDLTTAQGFATDAVVFHNGANSITTGIYRWNGINWSPASGITLNISSLQGGNASGTGSNALGVGANAAGTDAIAIGLGSKANAVSAISIGAESLGLDWGIAIGTKAHADRHSVAVGPNTEAHDNSIAIGSSALAHTENANAGAIAIGARATAKAHSYGGAIAIGTDAKATSQAGEGVGDGVTAIAMGDEAVANVSAVAIGYSAQGSRGGGVAIGYKASTIPTAGGNSSAVAIGDRAAAIGDNAIAIGGILITPAQQPMAMPLPLLARGPLLAHGEPSLLEG